VTLNLEILTGDLANKTHSPVVSVYIMLGAPDNESAVVDILGFSMEVLYNGTLSPVVFDVLTTEGETLLPQGDTTLSGLSDIDVNITNREMGIAFFFKPGESGEILFLPSGNYSGVCCWPSWHLGYSGSNISIGASVSGNSSLRWSIRLPSAKVSVGFLHRPPDCVVRVMSTSPDVAYGGAVYGADGVFLVDPAASLLVIADFYNPRYGWLEETVFQFQVQGAIAVTVTIEAPYIMFGPVGLTPITILFTAGLLIPVCLVILSKRKELRTGNWHNLSVRPGTPPFLLLVMSLLLPWPSYGRTGFAWYHGTWYWNSYTTIPAFMLDLTWNQLSIMTPTPIPLSSLVASCLLWASAAIVSVELEKEQDKQPGLLLACIAVIAGLGPPIVMSGIAGFSNLWSAPISLLGPIAAIAAILWPLLIGHVFRKREPA
jgi:hypothetical protein